MDVIGTYQERGFPKSRTTTIDWVEVGRSKHHVPILVELDVTAARSFIHNIKERSGEGLSSTGWVIKCLGQAISKHKHVHAMIKGRKNLVARTKVPTQATPPTPLSLLFLNGRRGMRKQSSA